MMVTNLLQNQKGFTLIETMLAISIMSIGILAMAALQATAAKGNSQAKKNSLAISLAEDRIEQYKNSSYSDIPVGIETETNIQPATATPESQPAWAIYTRTTNVQEDVPIPGVKTITVTVSWKNAVKSVSFTTIISQNGV